jgi:signal transduction histidine kinase
MGAVPTDAPPPSLNDQDVWVRIAHRWDFYFAVVAVAVAVAAATVDDVPATRRAIGVASVVVIAVLYMTWGHRLLSHEQPGPASAFIGTVLITFGAGAVADGTVSYLLFALCPLIFLSLPVRFAIPAVIAANLVPLSALSSIKAVTRFGPVFVVSGAFAVWMGVWINRVIEQSTERAALIAELESSRAEVARLSHLAGASAERARLAGEIHDTLAQGFTSIITLLQAADPELRDERLALAVRTAKENLAESRSLIASLAPAPGSLPDSVRRQTTRFTEECGIPAPMRVTGTPRALPTAVEVVLLRSAQEALANVRRHSGAQAAQVLLAYAGDRVRLVVRDDGCGFDPVRANGFGLRGMRARAEQVDGALTVHSDPEKGTTIELEVPA